MYKSAQVSTACALVRWSGQRMRAGLFGPRRALSAYTNQVSSSESLGSWAGKDRLTAGA